MIFHINPTFGLIMDFSGYFMIWSQNYIITLNLKLILDFCKVSMVKNPNPP